MRERTPGWMSYVLVAAGVYNLIWGAIAIAAPNAAFEMFGMQTPIYPSIWQCLGMVIGVYGIGYLIAASNPVRHWPIIFVGFLGKVFGPIGFVYAAVIMNELPMNFGWMLVPNDFIWWIPFALILFHAASMNQLGEDASFENKLTTDAALRRAHDQYGMSIAERSETEPVMLIFLRHFGCTFCRETLQDLEKQQHAIRRLGIDVVIVHMSDDDQARKSLVKYGLEQTPRVSDPEQTLYRSFDLSRGSFWQLFGPHVLFRGILAGLRGNSIGALQGDGFQMPGVFIVEHGRIVHAYRHKSASQRPHYENLACDAIEPEMRELLSNA